MRPRRNAYQSEHRMSAVLNKTAYKPKSIAAGNNLLTSIASALDLELHELAIKIDVPYRALTRLQRGKTGDTDIDPFWRQLAQYVDTRIAQLLAVREEMKGHMYKDGQKRVLQRARIAR
jgi:hypothetical protein